MIVPPTISEEMTGLSYFAIERDTTRRSNLQALSSDIDSFYEEHDGKYPKAPKTGCTQSIK